MSIADVLAGRARWAVIHGDCLDVMAAMGDDSVDAIVSDPPYGLAFMGKAWDHGVPGEPFWREALRVAKPGAYLVAFGGTRTYHRLACAIEDAGWEIRDCLSWLYGSGFPKSHNLAVAFDKQEGMAARGIGFTTAGYTDSATVAGGAQPAHIGQSDLARQWQGWGTALKPAWEPVILARKPLIGTVAANVTQYGTGGLNVDGCRIGFASDADRTSAFPGGKLTSNGAGSLAGPGAAQDVERSEFDATRNPSGRWPANVCLDEEAAGMFPESRFFYTAKASRREREAGLDRTCTVKHITGLCRQDNGVLVALLQRATSDTAPVSWVIGESGESILGLCPSDSLSTTLTAISRITPSQICDWWTPSLTSESTAVANSLTANGGSLAASAASESPSSLTTTSDGTESVRGVSGVVSLMLSAISDGASWSELRNIHSTVKPVALMRWLCRLVTPPGGLVLDPFTGSGTTGCAAVLEGFRFVGIEKEPEYVAIAEKRIAHYVADAAAQGNLFAPEAG